MLKGLATTGCCVARKTASGLLKSWRWALTLLHVCRSHCFLPDSAISFPDIAVNVMLANVLSVVQGIAFFHAGSDILRSKSLDRDSYNSGEPADALLTFSIWLMLTQPLVPAQSTLVQSLVVVSLNRSHQAMRTISCMSWPMH